MENTSVIQIADYAGSYSGNFIASLLALGNRLKERGLTQALIFPERAGERAWLKQLVGRGFKVYFLSDKGGVWSWAREISIIADKENAGIIHVHFNAFALSAGFAGIWMRLQNKNIRIIWHVHSYNPVSRSIYRKVKDLLKWRLVGRFVKVIAVSNEIMEQLIARGLTGKRTVVLNGIDVNKATAASRPKTELRKGLGIQKDKKVLLSFAWDPFIKGVDLLYEAVTQLGDPDVVLIIVGGSCVKDFISDRYGNLIPEWIKFLPPQERIADLYNAVDIFVSASRWEGCPYAVGEAMANGLPVISSNLASLQWARNGKGVVFFDSLNVANLKIAISDVIHWGPDALESCSQKNKEFINKNYSINQWVDKMISEYSEIQKLL